MLSPLKHGLRVDRVILLLVMGITFGEGKSIMDTWMTIKYVQLKCSASLQNFQDACFSQLLLSLLVHF